jgi:HK97 family phage prohead protease
MELKAFPLKIKSIADSDDDENGEFCGLASTYGPPADYGGDIVVPGAFTQSIKSQGKGLPVLWQHRTAQPVGIGKIGDSAGGLLINGRLVMADPVARRAYAHMRAGSVRGLSIGYDPIKSTPRDDGGRDLHEIRLHEVSLVTLPMNPRAEVAGVKALLPTLASLTAADLDDDDELLGDLRSIDHYVKRLLPRSRADADAAQLTQLKALDAALKAALG